MFLPGDLSRHEVIRGRLVVVFVLCCTAWSIVAFLMVVQYRIVALHRLTVFLVFYSVNTAPSQVDFYKCCPGILPFSWRCCPGICHGRLVDCFLFLCPHYFYCLCHWLLFVFLLCKGLFFLWFSLAGEASWGLILIFQNVSDFFGNFKLCFCSFLEII